MAQNLRKAVINGKPAAFMLNGNRVYFLHNSGKWSHDADAEVTNKKTFKYAALVLAEWSDLAMITPKDAFTALRISDALGNVPDVSVFLEGCEGFESARKPRQRKPHAKPANVNARPANVTPANVPESFEIDVDTSASASDTNDASDAESVAPANVDAPTETQEKPTETQESNAGVQYATPTANAAQDAFTQAFTPLFAGVVEEIERRVCARYAAEIQELRQIAKSAARKIEVVSPNGTHVVNGLTYANFDAIVATVNAGFPVYMYGPAGSGKSHTAKQVAEALGLPYFESMQVAFAHKLEGYGDAGGNFVPTPFYKAFTQGGLFFLDECDASAADALTVLNTAIANRRFEFPVIGNVEAHPNFRVIAAGNTLMSGADSEYVARCQQDASFKNRFFFVPVNYEPRIEEAMCNGDADILEFIRDMRASSQTQRVSLVCSYRQIKALFELGETWQPEDLLRGAVYQEKDPDEIRILYNGLQHKRNPWARATATICGED